MKFLIILLAVHMMTAQAQSNEKLTLKIAMPIKQLQFDPQKIEDMYSMSIVNQLYSKLFRYTPDGQVRTDLVEKWKVSKDKLQYTFTIRDSKFSDNTPITAQHVVNNLKRIFAIKAALASDLSIIKGAKSFFKTGNLSDLKIKVIDKKTLTIQTEKPTSLLIYLLSVPDVGIQKIEEISKDVVVNVNTSFSGVYKIKSITPDRLLLEKRIKSDLESSNPPQFIEFNLFSEINADIVAKGNLTDTSSFMTFDEKSSIFSTSDNWRPVASEITNERFLVLNPKKISKEVRHWLLSQVDSKKLVNSFNDSSIVPAYGFIPNCLPGHIKSSVIKKVPAPTLENNIELKVTYGANLPYAKKFKSFLSEVWKHPKIKLTFVELPIAKYLNLLFQKKGEIIIGARGLDYPEGFSVVTYFRSNIESNFFHINNKAIDRLIDKASEELDEQKRIKIYQEIQRLVLGEATVIPLAFGSWKKYYWSNRVSEVPAHPIGVHFIPMEMIAMRR